MGEEIDKATKFGDKKTAAGMHRAADMGIMRHLDILEALRIRFDVGRIGDAERPSISIVSGMRFARTDRDTATIVVTAKGKDLPEVKEGGRGDLIRQFAIDPVACWSRVDEEGDVVLLDEDDQPRVFPAGVLACYRDGKCLIPEKPIDCVVVWEYNDVGRVVGGKSLPYDLDAANREGWFDLERIGQMVVVRTHLFPVKSRARGGRGRVEGQRVHPSGMLIASNFPVADYAREMDVGLFERGRMIVAVPLPDANVTAASAAAATEAAEAASAELDIAEDISDLGPEEFVYGKGLRGNAWEKTAAVLATIDKGKITVERGSSLTDIKKAFRVVTTAKHPDRLQGRLVKTSTPKGLVTRLVNEARKQWWSIEAAFKRLIELREGQAAKVAAATEALTLPEALDGKDIKEVRDRKKGADPVGALVASALGVEAFDWKNANHLALRGGVLDALVKKAAPPVDPPAGGTGAEA